MFWVVGENVKSPRYVLRPRDNLGNTDGATPKGKKVVVFPVDDVCVIFNEVTRTGFTHVIKPKTGPKPPLRRKIRQYYRIETTAEHSPPIEIRIILPVPPPQAPVRLVGLKLWRWYSATKEWKDITKSFSQKYHLLIGQTDDRLKSMFGIT
jgi:hypothetical protein